MFFKKTTRGKSLYFNKKDFTILGQRDFIKKLSNDNYVYIVYQRVFKLKLKNYLFIDRNLHHDNA